MKKGIARLVVTILVISLLVSLDQFLKLWIHENIPKMSWLYPTYPYGGIAIFKDFFGVSFSLNYVENIGAAWGLFSQYPFALFIVRIVIVIALFVYLLFYLKEKKYWFALLLIISGAIGNILDVVYYGHVIDMFHFVFWGYSYPVFNLADSFITIGIAIIIMQSLFSAVSNKRK